MRGEVRLGYGWGQSGDRGERSDGVEADCVVLLEAGVEWADHEKGRLVAVGQRDAVDDAGWVWIGSGPCTLVSHRHRQQRLREFITLTQAQRVMTVAVGLYTVWAGLGLDGNL